MEPERRDTHTHIERDRRSGSGTAMSFIVGGLVVAVAIIGLVFWGGDFGGGGDVDVVGISTQDPTPAAAPIENNIEINTEAPDAGAVETETAPAAPAEIVPAVPAQN